MTANKFENHVISLIAKIFWKRKYESENIEGNRETSKNII